ncbi:SpoIID/LytB domain-containing protein [Crassaminicella thermophila]|nr:SpoIID/LytB domain-containing protein [Crassaminicella thermophila]
MINFKKLSFRFLLLLILIIILPFQVNANTQSKLINQVKIGIRFGDSATPLVSMYSPSGLELGYYIGNEFKSMISFIENEEIIIRKDSYFMEINGTFIEYDFDSQSDSYNTNIQGPIHIQIGDKFDSLDEANSFKKSLPDLMDNTYIVYEDGWRVWIGLYSSYSDAEAAFSNIKALISNAELRIIAKDSKRIQVLNKSGKVLFMYNTSNETYHFRPIPQKDNPSVIQLDGKSFRGTIIINRYLDSDLTVINQLDLEEYLYGVVPREISGDWPLEAQKAQAVAARSYAIVNLNRHKDYGFDLCSTIHCQVYGGYSSENPITRRAVDETKGEVLTYNGKVVTAFYHSNSGGHTEDSESVWSNSLGYLRGVEDPYSIGEPNDKWTKVYTREQIEEILASNGLSVGRLENITVEERSKNGRVLKVVFYGSKGNKTLEKGQIRNIFGYNNIKSTWFDIMSNADSTVKVLSDLNELPQEIRTVNKYIITAEGIKEIELQNKYMDNGNKMKVIPTPTGSDQYLFTGKGWGHGLGMSQWGAKKMAEEGFKYKQILTHYYTGTKIE